MKIVKFEIIGINFPIQLQIFPFAESGLGFISEKFMKFRRIKKWRKNDKNEKNLNFARNLKTTRATFLKCGTPAVCKVQN